MKFGMNVYVSGETPHAKKWKSWSCRAVPANGLNVIFESGLFFTVLDFLSSSGEQFLGSISLIFALNDMFQWRLIS